MKKLEGVKALAFVSIIAAICLILVLITTFTTGIGLVLMLVLPLCAALVTLYVDYKYVLVYVIATLLMSFINIQLALFIVLPSLLSGILFGILIKKYIHGYYIIFLNAVFLLLMQIGATYLINFIYNIDMIASIGSLLKLNEIGFTKIYYLFLFSLSITETSLCYVIITNELKKLSFDFNEKMNQFIPIISLCALFIALSIGFSFISPTICYLFIGASFYFGVILGYYIFSFHLHKRMLFMQIPLYVLSLIGIAVLFSIVPKAYLPCIFLLIPGCELLSGLYIIFYQKLYKKLNINESIFE